MRLKANLKFAANKFEHNNTITWGKKRAGKGLFWQAVINYRFKKWKRVFYWINTNFTPRFKKKQLETIQKTVADLTIAPNSYEKFISGQVVEIPRIYREKMDIYLDDGGNYLPSFQHKEITKLFPTMPSFLMLLGHISDSNFHVNYNGAFTRIYDKVREQADSYFYIIGSFRLFNIFYIKYRYYENSNTAELGLLPYKRNGLLDFKANKALRNQYYATNGLIVEKTIKLKRKHIYYDTRAYEKTLFGEQPRLQKEKKKFLDYVNYVYDRIVLIYKGIKSHKWKGKG